jgi:hypothetical protein
MPKIDLPKSDWALIYRALESTAASISLDLEFKPFPPADFAFLEKRRSDCSRLANLILPLFQEKLDAND